MTRRRSIHRCDARATAALMASAFVVLAILSRAPAEEAAADQKAKPLPPASDKTIDFDADIKGIFEQHCLKCHGPEKQESSFRLDLEAVAKKGGDNGVAYVAGDSSKSPLVKFIAGADPDMLMPPADSGIARLTDDQVGLIRAWIDQGARWPQSATAAADALEAKRKAALEHWAFKHPVRAELPAIKQQGWARTPIDYFILAQLEKAGLAPAPEADRYTLIRRLSLDLTGLPPTVEETNAFVNDTSPDAYEKLVERLLDSPHYGERWALWWLDVARYADTNGYEIDRPRSIWAYREWVIKALNSGMPFSQFIIEQLAGDLLPNATLDQKIATGFHRNTFFNEEGGHDPEQFRWEAVVDRASTTGVAFLGLTVGCAQCHDHKYDPVSQNEFYEFFAFFNNDDEPYLDLPRAEATKEREALADRIGQLEARLEEVFPFDSNDPLTAKLPTEERRKLALDTAFEAWRAKTAPTVRHWKLLEPVRWNSENKQTIRRLDDQSLLASGDRPEVDTFEVHYRTDMPKITAVRLEALPHPSLPAGGPGRGYYVDDGTFHLSEFSLAIGVPKPADGGDNVEAAKPERVKLQHPTASFENGKDIIRLTLDGDKHTGWRPKGSTGMRLVAAYDLAEPRTVAPGADLQFTLQQNLAHAQTIGRFRMWATSDEGPVTASDMPVDVEEAMLKAPDEWTAEEKAAAKKYYLSVAPEMKKENVRIAKARKSMPEKATTLVLEAREEPRVSHRHIRGDFHRPANEVTPNVPRFLHPLPDGPRNRLTLARWLVDERNPLIGRVLMNQIWQCYFGRGLLATPEDFGIQGGLAPKPSHPELLDWLACEFVEQGWDLKRMHRLIVTSAAYRQTSAATTEKLEIDPENTLISRGPRFRMYAELIRDAALAASGLLNPELGGPSVFPSQPAGVTEAAFGKFKWPTSKGEERYRRGLYTFRMRSAMYAAFSVFDEPLQNVCSMRRVRSNTPLQGLALLNDAAMVEAAQALGAKVVAEGPADDAGRLKLAFQRCLTRPPTDEEQATLLAYVVSERARFTSGDADALKVSGASSGDDKAANAELATWTMLSRVLLNLDETISKE